MRILVYGAGNIGSLYAALLARSGEEVSILARGARLDRLRAQGIELEDSLTGERTTTAVAVAERLDPGDGYDLVIVVLPRHRVHKVLPVLAAQLPTPALDRLYRHLDPAVDPVADGSAQIRLSWRLGPPWQARDREG